MKKPLTLKLLAMAALMLLLLIPISQIDGLIQDRQKLQQTVVADIAKSSSYHQTLAGPVWVQPYTKAEIKIKRINADGEKMYEEEVVNGELYFLPQNYSVDAKLTHETRKRGIYEARLYHAALQLQGEFIIPNNYGLEGSLSAYTFKTPYISLGISDIRGIEGGLTLEVDKKNYAVEPGADVRFLGEGVHAPLVAVNAHDLFERPVKLAMGFILQGTESLEFLPVGKNTHIAVASEWPHPSFMGAYLPMARSITEQGFTATWQTSFFATDFENVFKQCSAAGGCDALKSKKLGVSMIDPVNQYVKSDRAIKYASLFIVLTFAGFFLFELLKRLRVHPVQYGLVGLALALFYLLLMSLAEHIAFGAAYAISAVACVGLIGVYVSSILNSRQRALGFSAGLGALYAMLYGLLSSEDYALLMGALLIFALLGAFMLLTRHLDWYGVGKTETTPNSIV